MILSSVIGSPTPPIAPIMKYSPLNQAPHVYAPTSAFFSTSKSKLIAWPMIIKFKILNVASVQIKTYLENQTAMV